MTPYPRQYGKYVLLEPIGAGGMSEVDLAHRGVDDTSFVRFVAIKRVARSNLADESYVRMFMDEARINAELHHGNIVGVYDFGKQVDGITGREEYFMVMEYVPGLDLRALQRAAHGMGHRLPLRFCFSVLHEVLRGLQYAHTKADTLGRPMNLVHRDINPRNVMVSMRGEVKVIDFGVALAEDRLEKTQGRSLKGKFAYMSPEQIEGNVTLDGRTDLYAVGLMLHELVAGVGPFHGLTELQIMHRIVMGQIPPLQVPPEFPDRDFLLELHARALSRDRDRRFPDARAFRKAVERAADIVGGLATQDERAALVSSLAPQQVEGIAARLKGYHESSHEVSRSVSMVVPPPVGRADTTQGTLGGAQVTQELDGNTQELPRELIEPPPKPRRSLLLLLLLGALVAGVAVVIGGGAVALLLQERQLEPSPEFSFADLVGSGPGEIEPQPGDDGADRPSDEPLAGANDAVVASEPARTSGGSSGSTQAGSRPSSSGTASATGSSGGASQASPGSTSQPGADESPGGDQAVAGAPGGDAGSAQQVEPEPAVEPEPVVEAGPKEDPPAQPEPEPAPAQDGPKGKLLVNSMPKALPVSIDGVSVGTTPHQGSYALGAHRVVVHGPAGQICEQQATVVSTKPVLSTCSFDGQQGEPQDDDSKRRR